MREAPDCAKKCEKLLVVRTCAGNGLRPEGRGCKRHSLVYTYVTELLKANKLKKRIKIRPCIPEILGAKA